LACIERLSNAPRLKKASKRLKQCITSRRAILKERPAPVLFVGMYPPDFYEEDDRSAAGAHHSWEKVVRFDIESKTTTRLLDILNKIGKATCVAVDDSVFVFGSDDRTVFMFLKEQWHVAGTLTSGYDRHSMSATAAGRHVVFVGKEDEFESNRAVRVTVRDIVASKKVALSGLGRKWHENCR